MNTHYSSLQSEQSILEAGNFVKKNKENMSKAWGVLVKLSIVRILCSRKYSFDDESFSSKWVISFCFPLLSLSNSQKIIHHSRVARISLGGPLGTGQSPGCSSDSSDQSEASICGIDQWEASIYLAPLPMLDTRTSDTTDPHFPGHQGAECQGPCQVSSKIHHHH